ncbi:hypothetical protein [Mucilaginibacter sp. L196]|uniref:hypothetical protein n=1 Tax=Mucilaginibacter sp. L196 TaxID=1641870 RepID=UPI00131DB2A0|nr:hypothetical protein [Mucilaginibacter sp. L196]
MEDQQSINSILSFGAKSVSPDILERLLIGRERNAEYLFRSIEGIVNNGNNQQILIIGQRGMGKTHLLRILYHRCQPFIANKQLVVAYFAEEEYGVANYFDFLIRILYALIRWEVADKSHLEEQLTALQDVSTATQVSFAEKIIEDYMAGKPLLILAENFGDILNAIGSQEQGKLRAWMYKNNRVNIIATSQSISDDFDREDRPFYGFFNLYYLKSLSFKDSLNFLSSLAELDGRLDVVEHLKHKGRSQVRAVYELVKGNHRLLVTFYEFLKSDTLAKLSNHFIKTINDLKPYYETFIRYLPPQQQKIVRYIALSRRPQQGTSISKNCFIEQASLSKQLSELIRKKLIEPITDQTDKRNKLYDINEPLLRISIEVGEHKEGITALFVDFLAIYYDENELTNKILKFTDLLNNCQNLSEKKEFQYEILAIEKALKLKKSTGVQIIDTSTILKKINKLIDQDKCQEAQALLVREKENIAKGEYDDLLLRLYFLNDQFQEGVELFLKLDKTYIQKNHLYIHGAYGLFRLAKLKKDEELCSLSVANYEKAMKNNDNPEFVFSGLAHSLAFLADLKDDDTYYYRSFKLIQKAIELAPTHKNYLIDLAQWEIALAMKNKDRELADKGFAHLELASAYDQDNNKRLYGIWGGALSFASVYFQDTHFNIKVFLEKFGQLTLQQRLAIWKAFSTLHHFYLFDQLYALLQSDMQSYVGELNENMVEWITHILTYKKIKLQHEDLAFLRNATAEMMGSIPELRITQLYINTFEQYVLNGNKNAIYELPKEQRLFFEKYILGYGEILNENTVQR